MHRATLRNALRPVLFAAAPTPAWPAARATTSPSSRPSHLVERFKALRGSEMPRDGLAGDSDAHRPSCPAATGFSSSGTPRTRRANAGDHSLPSCSSTQRGCSTVISPRTPPCPIFGTPRVQGEVGLCSGSHIQTSRPNFRASGWTYRVKIPCGRSLQRYQSCL